MEWRNMLVAIFFGLWTIVIYRLGEKEGQEKTNSGTEPVKKKPSKYRYNAGDLLDPITPEEQRLEKKLSTRAKPDIEEDDE